MGKKIGMTQIFTEEGVMIPVTVVEAVPNKVIQIKTNETDGYRAVQIGFVDLKERRANKPTKGHFKKWGTPLKKYVAEVKLEEGEEYMPKQAITVADFEEGKLLDVTGTSKGKGTQGNIKRHGHHRGPMTHGSKHKRLAGALAAASYPARVFKGNAGPGRMGCETVTVQNIELVKIIPERNVMLIKGAIPGSRGGIVTIKYATKAHYPDEVRLATPKEVVDEKAAKTRKEAPVADEPEVIEAVEEAAEAAIVEEAAAEPVVEEAVEAAVVEAEAEVPTEKTAAEEAPPEAVEEKEGE